MSRDVMSPYMTRPYVIPVTNNMSSSFMPGDFSLRHRSNSSLSTGSSKSGNVGPKSSKKMRRTIKLCSPVLFNKCENKEALPLNGLPLTVLKNIAEELSFADAKTFRSLSKKLYMAEKATRIGRKKLSVTILRKLFPEDFLKSKDRVAKDDSCVGLLQVAVPLQKFLHMNPMSSLNEVDLTGISSFSSQCFERIVQSVDIKSAFQNVGKLDLHNCVLKVSNLEWLSRLMPAVWFIVISPGQILFRPGVDDRELSKDEKCRLLGMLDATQRTGPQSKISNIMRLPSTICGNNNLLQIIALLTHLFTKLEIIRME
ncbi:hypothetical protein DdX_06732 [Ditylenchus destructor]|uniref:F-box domain-containing protein n=1 Tax=Ditylenchus destructor TaxID=166010 RepID=A0AAD4R9D8_9BILA|nr:hypothetical protein DdX_06732 [Ditylenchus destructor]